MRRTFQDLQAENQRKTYLWLGALFLILTSLTVTLVGVYDPKHWWVGIPIGILVSLVACVVAIYSGPSIVLAISGAREATPAEDQVLSNVVEEMAIAAGMPKPKVFVMDDASPNAFATGRDIQSGVICVTTGLLMKLDRDELQGVVAHELAHIRNYDIRLTTTVAIIVGIIPLIADTLSFTVRFGGRHRGNREGAAIFMIIGLILSILAPLAAFIIQMAISREREYLADATAAQLTRYPDGLARALEKISRDRQPLDHANRATQHMYISNPMQRVDIDSVMSTHPPTAERVRRLRQMGAEVMENPDSSLEFNSLSPEQTSKFEA